MFISLRKFVLSFQSDKFFLNFQHTPVSASDSYVSIELWVLFMEKIKPVNGATGHFSYNRPCSFSRIVWLDLSVCDTLDNG